MGLFKLQLCRGLGDEAERHLPSALQHSSDDISVSTAERRSRGGVEGDVCQNNAPPGCII